MFRTVLFLSVWMIFGPLTAIAEKNEIPENMGHLKLMILVEEMYLGMESTDMDIAAVELSQRLLSHGFTLVDKAQLEAVQMREIDRQAVRGNIDAVANLGLRFGCQYVIMGKAVAKDEGEVYEGSGLRSIQASLQLRLIHTETAIVLGSVVKSGVAAHINQSTGATKALQDAARKAVEEYLYNEITESFERFKDKGSPINLSISGVNTFRMSQSVYERIKDVSGVVSSTKERWNSADGILLLDLRFQGSSDQLATRLDRLNIVDTVLEVIDLSQDRVDCNLR